MHNESDSSKGGIQASSSSGTPERFLKCIMSSAIGADADMSLLRTTSGKKNMLYDLGVPSTTLRDKSMDGFLGRLWLLERTLSAQRRMFLTFQQLNHLYPSVKSL